MHQMPLSAFFRSLFFEEEGQGLAEYGLILGLVAVASIAALTGMGDGINAFLSKTAGSFNK